MFRAGSHPSHHCAATFLWGRGTALHLYQRQPPGGFPFPHPGVSFPGCAAGGPGSDQGP